MECTAERTPQLLEIASAENDNWKKGEDKKNSPMKNDAIVL